MKFYNATLTSLLLIIPMFSYSQNKSKEDVSKYFEDGGISTSKNLVKLNLASVIIGDAHFSYERILTPSIGIEIGVGFLLPFYNKELSQTIFGIEDKIEATLSKPDSGISFSIQPKLYFRGNAPESSYAGLLYRTRIYTQGGQKITFNDYAFNSGTQLDLTTRIHLDLSVGVGLRIVKNELNENETTIAIPIGIKIGYLF